MRGFLPPVLPSFFATDVFAAAAFIDPNPDADGFFNTDFGERLVFDLAAAGFF